MEFEMSIKASPRELDAIRGHAARDYPNECCGILLGREVDRAKEVSEAVPLKNLRTEPDKAQAVLPLEAPGRESERNRFLIDPLEQLKVEKDARARGLDVVGYYHSHPDHPARPSNYDRDHAWPWYSYLIISVERGKAGELLSWTLSEDRSRFDPESLEVRKPSSAA